MSEKRLIVDEDYNIVDTVTGEWLDDTQVFDLANELYEENERLRKFIDLMNMRQKWKLYNYMRDKDSEKNCKVEVGENVKRFALEYDSNCYKCISDNEQKELYSSRESICDLLNQLNDEKEQLKNYFKKRAECSNFQINKLKEEIAELQEDNVDTIVELSKENEQLKKQFKRYEDGLWVRFTRLEKENEQLRELIEQLGGEEMKRQAELITYE